MAPKEIKCAKRLLSWKVPHKRPRTKQEQELIQRFFKFEAEHHRDADKVRQEQFLDWQPPASDDPQLALAVDLVNAGANV